MRQHEAPRCLHSYGVFAALACPDSNHFFHRHYEDLAVADLSCPGSPLDGINHLIDQFIGNDQFDLNLGREVDFVFGATIDLGVAFLPSV